MKQRFFIWLILFALIWRFFSIHPQIDLTISHWFYLDGTWLGSVEPFAILREIYYRGSIFVAVYILFYAVFMRNREGFAPKFFYRFFAWFSVLGSVVLVNYGFKEYFGRARPFTISEFGGDKSFTPVSIFPVDQCAHNCSFVSGEASAAMVLILAGIALSNGQKNIYKWVWITMLPMAIMRVMAGKHFVSDVILAMTLMVVVYYLFLWIFKHRPEDLRTSFAAFGSDFLALFRR